MSIYGMRVRASNGPDIGPEHDVSAWWRLINWSLGGPYWSIGGRPNGPMNPSHTGHPFKWPIGSVAALIDCSSDMGPPIVHTHTHTHNMHLSTCLRLPSDQFVSFKSNPIGFVLLDRFPLCLPHTHTHTHTHTHIWKANTVLTVMSLETVFHDGTFFRVHLAPNTQRQSIGRAFKCRTRAAHSLNVCFQCIHPISCLLTLTELVYDTPNDPSLRCDTCQVNQSKHWVGKCVCVMSGVRWEWTLNHIQTST